MIVTFSEHLASLMKAHGFNKSELGRRAGLSHVAVGNYLKGRMPKYAEADRLARVFGIDPDYLLNPTKYSSPLREAAAVAKSIGGPAQQQVFEAELKRRSAHLHGARGVLFRAREAKGLSQKELAKAVGYSLSVYQGIEEGTSSMSRKQAEKVAKVLEVDVEDLLDGSDHPPENGAHFGTFGETPEIQMPPGQRAKFVPLISMAQCGPHISFSDESYTREGFLAMNPKDPQAFAVKLSGDSMLPVHAPGDVAVIYPGRPPRNGDTVIARLTDEHGGDVMCKIYQAGSDQVTLSSYNPAFAPISFPRAAFEWIYTVASVTKIYHG